MRHASVYWRQGVFLMHAEAKTSHGYSIAKHPALALTDASPDSLLGRCVRLLLAEYTSGGAPPSSSTRAEQVFLPLIGLRSWLGFMRGSPRCLDVTEADNADLCLTLWAREGSGFVPPLTAPHRTLNPGASDSSLGGEIRDLLAGLATRDASEGA